MLIPFDQMPHTSRVWIYQADRKLQSEEVEFVKSVSQNFLSDWSAHGNALKASFTVEHAQFLVLTVDEGHSQASGCSIDSSVHLIKALEEKLNVSLTNSGNVAFLVKNEVIIYPFQEIKSKVAENKIQPQTQIFDNTVKNIADFRTNWLVDSKESWVGRFF